ncbi:DUF1326 domain-containing protein [Rhodospirillaceae bacterium SYSU D60014]|uniref:DUF1326 domain-containing protein n=1 Tax=Virgifigura deserti TaxID=2268457 RepID=UPI000E6733D6
MTAWEIHGMEFGNCNCSYGCPCQFNALPTHGHCRAIGFFRIDEGHFGDTPLDGLNMAIAVSWPGPVHEGHGTMQPVIDERADEAQRHALLSILTGKETDEFATFFAVYSAMCDRIHDPVYTKIRIDADMGARTADCEAVGVAAGRGEPIRNPVTGAEHRVGILLPNGFEYTQNEVGRGWSASSEPVTVTLEDSYAHWCELHLNQHGVIR